MNLQEIINNTKQSALILFHPIPFFLNFIKEANMVSNKSAVCVKTC